MSGSGSEPNLCRRCKLSTILAAAADVAAELSPLSVISVSVCTGVPLGSTGCSTHPSEGRMLQPSSVAMA